MRLGLMAGLGVVAAVVAVALAPTPAGAVTLYGVPTSGNFLVKFDSAAPQTITSVVAISGLQAGERIAGIDFRPAGGQLFGLGLVPGATDTVRIYTIDTTTGVATAVGPAFATDFVASTTYGFDFNPTVDRIRIVNASGENARANPNNGARADTPTNDTNLNPGTPSVVAVAYDRNDTDASTGTTLFGIDTSTDTLVTIGGVNQTPSPNAGTVFSVGPLGVDAAGDAGFDIDAAGTLFASLTVGGVNQLHTINPATGAATLVGAIGGGNLAIGALAAAFPTPANLLSILPASGSFGSNQRFDLELVLAAPGRVVTGGQAILNGADVTAALAACVVPGTLVSGGTTFKCAGLGGPVFGVGTQTLQITLQLDDNSSHTSTVTYTIFAVVGP
jgi:hypothetical protein